MWISAPSSTRYRNFADGTPCCRMSPEGGKHTVVTNGEHKNFREMPYVGGYLDKDQTINTMGSRQKARLSGDDRMWGSRFIYPLPTSDSAKRGYPRLGSNDTGSSYPTARGIDTAGIPWAGSLASPSKRLFIQQSLSNRSRSGARIRSGRPSSISAQNLMQSSEAAARAKAPCSNTSPSDSAAVATTCRQAVFRALPPSQLTY